MFSCFPARLIDQRFFRGSHTTNFVTWGFSRSYDRDAEVPSSKRNAQASAQPIDKLQNHAGFRLDDTFHHDLSGSIHVQSSRAISPRPWLRKDSDRAADPCWISIRSLGTSLASHLWRCRPAISGGCGCWDFRYARSLPNTAASNR
jgi:hypothetical protein